MTKYIASLVTVAGGMLIASSAFAQLAPINTTALGNVSIHAGSLVSTSGGTRIIGDITVSPGANVSILPPGTHTGATEQNTDAAKAVATASKYLYDNLHATVCDSTLHRDAGNQTYGPGVYCTVADFFLRNETTLDAGGNPNAVFVFRAETNFTFASDAKIILTNGAKWQNVYFLAGSYAMVGTDNVIRGTVIARNNINVNSGALVTGRLLSLDGTVDLVGAVLGNGSVANLTLMQVVSATGIPEGEAFTYMLSVVNAGPDSASGVMVSDVLPKELELVNTTASQGNFADGVWNVGTVLSGETIDIDLTVRPRIGTQGISLKNTAELTASGAVDPNSIPGNGLQGEDDLTSTFIMVAAPKPVSQQSSAFFNPTSERDAAQNIEMNSPSAQVTPVSGGPVTLPCTPGALFRGSQPAVYYCTSQGKRLVFPDDRTFATWYPDYSGVVKMADKAIEKIPLAGAVKYRPGVKLVKIVSDPKVYAVSKNGTLRWVSSEIIAIQLYGANWSKMVDDIPDAFFFNYSIGEPVTSL